MTKEQLDLPLYRGRSVKTKQYVEGYLKTCTDTGANVYWIQTKEWIDYQVEPETLSISFPDMKILNDNRIFASLSNSGKGGDMLQYTVFTQKMMWQGKKESIKTNTCKFTVKGFNLNLVLISNDYYSIKGIGIQE